MRATRLGGVLAVLALAIVMLAGAAAASAKVAAPAAQGNLVLYSTNSGAYKEFPLKNGGDEAAITVARDQLVDGNGTNVGRHHWQCVRSDLAWFCNGVIRLKDTAKTDRGTITVTGLFNGFNGEAFAITGGTGAYAGAEGTVILSVKNGKLARTVKLI